MRRLWTASALVVALLACNPGSNAKHCEGVADFVLMLESSHSVIPADTEIEVTFGGGSEETFRLAASNDPEVLFCETTEAPLPAAGGAGGEGSDEPGGNGSSSWHAHSGASASGGHGGAPKAISSIRCEIWSGGPATVSIHAGGWHTTRELKADDKVCSSTEVVVLGEPEKKP